MEFNKKISKRIIQKDTTIIESLKIMDAEKMKLLFVFDGQKFLGLVTIGDIQRSIIKNIQLNIHVNEILDKNKIYAKKGDLMESIKLAMLQLRAECMPVVDDENNLVDVIYWEDLFEKNIEFNRAKIDLPVVIMAGGLGIRLKPLTNVIPKPLIPLNEKTILEVILDKFEKIGCTKFYLSVNYKYEWIQFYLDNLHKKYNVELFKESTPLGTIGSVSLLKGKIDKPFFVSNCDIIIDQDFRDVYEYHVENGNEITIITSLKSFEIPYGVIETGDKGILTGLSEKPDINYMINTGVYILQPELINEIPEGSFFHITQLIDKVKEKGGRIGCFPVSEKSWTDIGDWNEYLKIINSATTNDLVV